MSLPNVNLARPPGRVAGIGIAVVPARRGRVERRHVESERVSAQRDHLDGRRVGTTLRTAKRRSILSLWSLVCAQAPVNSAIKAVGSSLNKTSRSRLGKVVAQPVWSTIVHRVDQDRETPRLSRHRSHLPGGSPKRDSVDRHPPPRPAT